MLLKKIIPANVVAVGNPCRIIRKLDSKKEIYKMKQELSHINQIPVILYGESCNKVLLVIHGRGGNKEESARLALFALRKRLSST